MPASANWAKLKARGCTNGLRRILTLGFVVGCRFSDRGASIVAKQINSSKTVKATRRNVSDGTTAEAEG